MIPIDSQDSLKAFLLVYFYQIETELNSTRNGLESVKFQSEEANTDEHLKKYFQAFLLAHNNLKDVQLTTLKLKTDSIERTIEIHELKAYRITNVLLPEQLTLEQKKRISESKKSVYTNPDLYLEITNGENTFFESVELKSTKENNIPGSSVQQVSPFEWVIFVKRENENVVVTTGFYINSITEKLPFPDRSPRPQVGFKTLLDWNKNYRKVENEVLTIETISEIFNTKIKLLTDWQDYLASEWIKIIMSEQIRSSEKWFNNTLRKFCLKFLEYSEELTESEIENLKNNLKRLIK